MPQGVVLPHAGQEGGHCTLHGPVLVSTAIEICDWRDPVATSGIRGTIRNAESDILAEVANVDAEYEALVAEYALVPA